jgi:uncharacterized protein (TIGR02147 family)
LAAMKLTAQEFSYVSEWIHFAILSLMNTPNFRPHSAWIAERFGVSELEVERALERLLNIGLITKNEFGHIDRTSARTNTTDDVLNLSLQKAHMRDMEMARDKIITVPVEQRDFSFLIFNGNPKYMPQTKEILRRTQDELEELMDKDDA